MQLAFIQQFGELLAGGVDAVSVSAVNHIDHGLRVLVVVSPQRANLVLASHIPHSE